MHTSWRLRSIFLIGLAFSGCQPTPDGGGGGGGGGTADDAGPSADAGRVGDGGGPLPEGTAGPGRRVLRRLAHEEYVRSIHDLLGLEVDAAAAFAADPIVDGFANHAGQLRVSALLVDQYRSTAEALAAEADLARILPCAGETGACARRFVREFGLRVIRRPLTEEEAARYDALFDAVVAEEGFAAGIRLVLGALLQSPHFLYRTELGRQAGAVFVLTPYEIATALSYLFWRTTPDPELLAHAADGTLLDPAVRAAQVERLLNDDRTTATARAFVTGWLGLERLPQVNRDPGTYPTLTPELRTAMAAETADLVTALWEGQGTLADLLLSSRPYAPLAEHYAEDPAGARVGILGHASVLTTYALPRTSSPIHRGLMVRERLLCQDLPPPPANLDTSPPPVDPSLSTRERYAQHASRGACVGCHQLIDPIGFVFEHFDGIGRYRTLDGEHPIDASGRIVGTRASNGDVDGLPALAAHLAASPEVAACYALEWLRYGTGGAETLGDPAADAARLAAALAATDGVLTAPLVALVDQPHFTERLGEPGERDVPGAELTPDAPGMMPEQPEVPDPPDLPDPPGPVGAVLVLEEASRWATGYCANGKASNPTADPLTWTVEADIEGTINNLWNAVSDANTGHVQFSGMPYNAVIGPGQAADFGFCATLP